MLKVTINFAEITTFVFTIAYGVMKTIIFQWTTALFFCSCFLACQQDHPVEQKEPVRRSVEALGPVSYGGTFRYNEEEYFRHLFPQNIRDVQSRNIAANLYEGLVTLSMDSLHIVPSIAGLPEISNHGSLFTFRLRNDVYFHDDACFNDGKGRKVNAYDFKYCFDLLCTAHEENGGFWIFDGKVKGAREHYEQTLKGIFPSEGVEGITVLDSFVLVIELERPYAEFSALLTTPFTYVFPQEAIDKYGTTGLKKHAVGSGPFKLANIIDFESLVMVRNENYREHDAWGNQLPYLDSVRLNFHRLQKTALLEFERNRLDMVFRIPLELYDEILDEEGLPRERYRQFKLQSTQAFSTEFYGFQHTVEQFSNPLLRKALAYAIDRAALATDVFKGMAIPNYHGVVPYAMQIATGYPIENVKGFGYNPEKARLLMDSAGYTNRRDMEKLTLQINEGGGKNEPVAFAIKEQVKEVLGIELDIRVLPFREHFELIESGKTGLFRVGWSADYVSPENFLRSYYGPEKPENEKEKANLNVVRYQNAAFDQLYEAANRTVDRTDRQILYARADSLLMEDAVVIPLFNNIEYRLLQANVQNFPQNAMEFRQFKEVYFQNEKEQGK